MPKLEFDPDYIERLADLLQRSGLTEIEVSHGETKIRVAKQVQALIDYPLNSHSGSVRAEVPQTTPNAEPVAPATSSTEDHSSHPGTLTSPMVGMVYTAPEPNSSPFVSVGSIVEEGETLLIIEAMKVMNMIRAPKSGRVTKIFIENGQPVEFGEPLLIIE